MLINSPPEFDVLQRIAARCSVSDSLNQTYAGFVVKLESQQKLRLLIVSHAAVLAIELHGAIALLTSRSHFASAHALIRPLMETTARSIWVLYVADFQSVQQLAGGTRKPDLEFLVKTLKRSKTEEIKNLGVALNGMAGLFNSFAHIGVEQLRRREDGFEEKEVLAGLLISDVFAMVASEVLAQAYRCDELGELNRANAVRFAAEGHQNFGGPQPGAFGRPALPEVPAWPDLQK